MLNACNTPTLGALLLQQGDPRVICWGGRVCEAHAKAFAGVFCARLCHLRTHQAGVRAFAAAVDAACAARQLDVDRESRERCPLRNAGISAGAGPPRAPTQPALVEPTDAKVLLMGCMSVRRL